MKAFKSIVGSSESIHDLSPRVASYKEVKERRNRKTTGIIGKIVVFALLLIYAVCLMLPFYVLFVTSITPYQELMGSMSFIWWPEEVTWDAFIPFISTDNILADDIGIPILHGFFNTLWSTLLTTIISLFVSGLAAYSYSKIRFRGKEALFMFQLATMMIPMATMTVPSLIWYETLGWTHSWFPIIIPGLFGGATTIFFLRSYMASVPNETLEAAKIDGLGSFRIFLKIVLPQTIPAFIAQFIFAFVGGYNNYMGPLLYLSDNPQNYTLQLVVTELRTFYNQPGQVCASCLIALIPLIIVYIIFQRFFIEGISVGGGKE